MASKSESTGQFGEREIMITRIIDAPRSLVFSAWSDPEQVANWWGPKGFTTVVYEWDATPGGAIWLVMRAPNGWEHPMGGAFREVAEPERLVFTALGVDKDGKLLLKAHTTVTFTEDGGKTKLTLHARASARDSAGIQMIGGMEAGWTGSLDRFEDHVANVVGK